MRVQAFTRDTFVYIALGCAASAFAFGCTASTEQPFEISASEAEFFHGCGRPRGTDGKLRCVFKKLGYGTVQAAPSVRQELVDLGQALAFDKILSGNRDISCLTCHHPALNTDDDRSLPIGVGGTGLGDTRTHSTDDRIPRSAPPLFNLHAYDSMFWDNRIEVLADGSLITPAGAQLTPEMEAVFEFGVVSAQAMFPVTARDEMRGHVGENEIADIPDSDLTGIWGALMVRLGAIPKYVAMFEAAYPGTAFDDMNFAHAANAIAGFEVASFDASRTPFARFMQGKRRLSWTEKRAALDFLVGRCASCHTGPMFSDFASHNTGLAQFGPGKGDGPSVRDDFGRFRETGVSADRYAFRTPPLINVELTAPYGHVGQHADLVQHIEHYIDPSNALWGYVVEDRVSDTAAHGTQLDNQSDVLSTLDGVFSKPRLVRPQSLERFLKLLTDPAARDLSHTIPSSVPSGLPVED